MVGLTDSHVGKGGGGHIQHRIWGGGCKGSHCVQKQFMYMKIKIMSPQCIEKHYGGGNVHVQPAATAPPPKSNRFKKGNP